MSRQPDQDDFRKESPCSIDPFTSLTKFIDEAISYTLQSVVGLPSSKEDIHSWKPREELQHRDKYPWGWGDDEKHQNRTAGSASLYDRRPSYETQTRLPDPDSQPSTYESADESFERCNPTEALARLENFLNFSRYSPTILEEDPELRPLRENWRHAFTDLMSETQGGPLPNLTQDANLTTNRLNADAWKSYLLMNSGYNYHISALHRNLTPRNATSLLDPLSLAIYINSVQNMSPDIERHQRQYSQHIRKHHPELGKELDEQYLSQHSGNNDNRLEDEGADDEESYEENDDVDEEAEDINESTGSSTELGMFEEILKTLFVDQSNHNRSPSTEQHGESASSIPPKPSIVGRLTRTERIVRPDGTTETRRVLKTRFSDGTENEESSSNIVMGQARRHQDDSSTSGDSKAQENESAIKITETPNDSGKSGWFWRRSSS